jgi:hypothetical protein
MQETGKEVPAFDLLRNMFRTWLSWNSLELIRSWDDYVEDSVGGLYMDQLFEMLSNSYWQRLWIRQEILMVQHLILIYGTQSLDWKYIGAVRKLVEEASFRTTSPPTQGQRSPLMNFAKTEAALLDWQRSRMIDNRQTINTLSLLLRLSQNTYCQDPLDRIYRLLGLANQTGNNIVTVDYSKSVYDLWKWCVIYETQHLSLFEIVCFAQGLQEILLGPSKYGNLPHDMGYPRQSYLADVDLAITVGANMIGRVSVLPTNPNHVRLSRDVISFDYSSQPYPSSPSYYVASKEFMLSNMTTIRHLWKADHISLALVAYWLKIFDVGTWAKETRIDLVFFEIRNEDVPTRQRNILGIGAQLMTRWRHFV